MAQRDIKSEMDNILAEVWGPKAEACRPAPVAKPMNYVTIIDGERKRRIEEAAAAMAVRLYAPG